jgi:hypothetical protein
MPRHGPPGDPHGTGAGFNVAEADNTRVGNMRMDLYNEPNDVIPWTLEDSSYDNMLGKMSERYGSSREDIENLMNRISFHESKDVADQQQGDGGPGRGLFQFEQTYQYPEGHELEGQYGQAGGMTARNRLANYYEDILKEEPPDWLTQENMNNPEVGFDASILTPDQQKMMFLANTRMNKDKGANFSPANIKNTGEWWRKHHWAGAEKDAPDRLASFARDMSEYERLIYEKSI